MTEYGVILFHTTSSVMRAEKLLTKADHTVKLIPTPRQFSSDCGIALRFEWSQCEQVRSVLDAASVEIDSVHRL
ncbi:hypothetical protein HKBW3S42_01050 [Candidatus Hakubella thermalkaliphila]|uniref:Putative Se/S carrier protein-like domain-containing protein n=1 Tax=Candidatus Hakubella thermalkaliphila TaxID=2754717 RepID=A0A6V8PLX5_9ACTN|nr:hypothetical protein HKBW3S42_01050 [Candidatus Hakubella thermalkaliphila]